MNWKKGLRGFFLPKVTTKFLFRVAVVAITSYLVFGHVCTPLLIRGKSMEPTYRDGSFNFCLKPRYLFSEPAPFDVVVVSLAGKKVMYLKRVVALEGDTVEFRDGILYVNDAPLDEPYVHSSCNWVLPKREVGEGRVYLIGDFRSMPMEQHDFGQTAVWRIAGAPLW
jgi:signal peptidase I